MDLSQISGQDGPLRAHCVDHLNKAVDPGLVHFREMIVWIPRNRTGDNRPLRVFYHIDDQSQIPSLQDMISRSSLDTQAFSCILFAPEASVFLSHDAG